MANDTVADIRIVSTIFLSVKDNLNMFSDFNRCHVTSNTFDIMHYY